MRPIAMSVSPRLDRRLHRTGIATLSTAWTAPARGGKPGCRARSARQPSAQEPACKIAEGLCRANAITKRRRRSPVGSRSGFGPLHRRAQMERLRPGQVLVLEAGERAAAAGVLDSGPSERRVEVVAAVHEPGAGLDPIADPDRRVLVRRPDRRGQAIATVVHEADRLVV